MGQGFHGGTIASHSDSRPAAVSCEARVSVQSCLLKVRTILPTVSKYTGSSLVSRWSTSLKRSEGASGAYSSSVLAMYWEALLPRCHNLRHPNLASPVRRSDIP